MLNGQTDSRITGRRQAMQSMPGKQPADEGAGIIERTCYLQQVAAFPRVALRIAEPGRLAQ